MFTMSFDTSGESFKDDPVNEIIRILMRAISQLESGDSNRCVCDLSHNVAIGTWRWDR